MISLAYKISYCLSANHYPELRCVICTGVTLFALVLHFLHWCYTWTVLLSANQNRVIFSCVLLHMKTHTFWYVFTYRPHARNAEGNDSIWRVLGTVFKIHRFHLSQKRSVFKTMHSVKRLHFWNRFWKPAPFSSAFSDVLVWTIGENAQKVCVFMRKRIVVVGANYVGLCVCLFFPTCPETTTEEHRKTPWIHNNEACFTECYIV